MNYLLFFFSFWLLFSCGNKPESQGIQRTGIDEVEAENNEKLLKLAEELKETSLNCPGGQCPEQLLQVSILNTRGGRSEVTHCSGLLAKDNTVVLSASCAPLAIHDLSLIHI